MLVELNEVEQRYQAVLEVFNDGASVTDVARRHGVARQTVHEWLRRYAANGLAGLVDQPSRPQSCPHQMSAVVEARIVELRGQHPGWGPRTIGHRLRKEGFDPVPGRSSIYRCLIRHGLVTPAGPEAQEERLQALGAVAVDGAMADGHRRRRQDRGWVRSEDRLGGR